MVVVIADYLPPAVRGRMKLWFIEVRANVFVSGINDAVATDVVEYLFQHCPADAGLTVFQKINAPPGYKISGVGDTKRAIIRLSGMQLIQEKCGQWE